ncbi:MAG: hydantoinase/oxoprolinase family protein [Rhodospirillales bacterium]|jgi:N-methylhydantoinase A|nr:hydantoinase/oxoprolinase family protein [Rhodospirillales bacterium]MBT4041085.1 hydantoinase/oxoprolinase family protein [Rhodospirillales bacterium]MBT4628408.1 hydantoinase/oxoprolinase family protein [Rhodospirillales bacterium]MBT5350825.1 hydantoinase/oxoprolinase family protein [Rhodospirillales bacterium]MBT5522353.1 hydantoinase/oxoprolinase family protein [Rhodospirillales bacterium]
MYYLSADVGGTFTDLVLIDTNAGRAHVDKVPSAERGSAASIVKGLDRIVEKAGLERSHVDLFVHGFTVGTNAFLMRTGARVVMVLTDGFRDVLEIGDQLRPELYSLQQNKPVPVVPRSRILEIAERIDSFGEVVQEISDDDIARVIDDIAALEPEAISVCLNFSFVNDVHERKLGEALRQKFTDIPVYLSCDVNPEIEEYPRTNTTAIAGYLGPIIDKYLRHLEKDLQDSGVTAPLRLMRSDGGMSTPRAARTNPATMMLSGPAGGVIASAYLGQRLEIENLVTFDMGGTSADFSTIVGGSPKKVNSRSIDGQPLRLPTLDIETISAGGGSIGWIDRGGAIRVGPHSAGSIPGPACYGKGGVDATITDASVVLGLLAPEDYLGGEVAIDPVLARKAVQEQVATPLGLSVEEAALGIVFVANALMNQAIRTLSVERGLDIRRFSLLAFGGAGPLYSSYLIRDLGMSEVIVPRHPGVFAAEGLLLSDIRHTAQRPYRRSLASIDQGEIASVLADIISELAQELDADGVPEDKREFHCSVDLRYVGQFHEIDILINTPNDTDWWNSSKTFDDFVELHDTLFGHADQDEPLESICLRVEAQGYIDKPELVSDPDAAPHAAEPYGTRDVYIEKNGDWQACDLYRREDLSIGAFFTGPAIVTQVDSTVLILSGQAAHVVKDDVIRIRETEGDK